MQLTFGMFPAGTSQMESARRLLHHLIRTRELHNPFVCASHPDTWREIWLYECLRDHGFFWDAAMVGWLRTQEVAARAYRQRFRANNNRVGVFDDDGHFGGWVCRGCGANLEKLPSLDSQCLCSLGWICHYPAWFNRDDLCEYARWLGVPVTPCDTRAQILAHIQTAVRARSRAQAGEPLARASSICPTCGLAWTVHPTDEPTSRRIQ